MKPLQDETERNHLDEVNAFHSHCEQCIKVAKCIVLPTLNESCAVVTCELNCGFRFHACKVSEHKLLCANEKVACINADNGCPVVMFRSQRAQHLETCPASVVVCTMEWNRWPICSKERKMHIPFHVPNPWAKQGQLDVALALRDQRMLNGWLKVPRRTRRVLRNSLTCCFPAVPILLPIQVQVPIQALPSSANTPIELSDTSILSPEENKKTSDFTRVPQGMDTNMCNSSNESIPDVLIHSSTLNDECSDESSVLQLQTKFGCDIADRVPSVELNGNTETRIMNSDIKYFTNTHVNENVGVFNDITSCLSSSCKTVDDSSALSGKKELNESSCDKSLVHFLNNFRVTDIFSSSKGAHTVLLPPPPPSPPLIMSLGLDLTMESITRYQTKPKNMYTFLCAKEFRRDEYSWHYKNVHSDIHGGLNGWLEYRCPLAHYGCTYSLRRLYPSTIGASVIYNDILESFGVEPCMEFKCPGLKNKSVLATHKEIVAHINKSCSTELKYGSRMMGGMSEQPVELCQLPFEVQRHICRFLDSFSLCNLALTCRRLREVCCSLLNERGIVVQQWRKKTIGSKSTWTIAYKRWFFSTAFTPVQSWGFEGKDHMSNHLQSCSFFERNAASRPYFHLFNVEPSPDLQAKLLSSIPNGATKEYDRAKV